jgi:serine/threonine protein kinase
MAGASSPQPGSEPIPGYRLRQPLGRGGFGEVWEAEVAGGPNVALKFMPFASSLAATKEIRAIQVIRQLAHPGLTAIERIWTLPGYVVICMELAEGSLLDLLTTYQTEMGSPIPPDQVLLYLTQVADTLDFLNARQHMIDGQKIAIQHADVKPSNMLLFGDTVKLCDFGLATQTATRFRTHRRQGTPDYAAPEVFAGQLSQQTDQYALAVSYCQLRGGQLPFPPVPSFRNSWPARRPNPDLGMLSPPEQPVIARALRRVPTERWPSCREMLAQLAGALGLSLPAEQTPAGMPAGKERRAAPRRKVPHTPSCTVTEGHATLAMAVQDISSGGIGLVSDRPLDKGTRLVIHLDWACGASHALRASVCHSTPQGEQNWRIGCLLLEELSEQDMALLTKTNGHQCA